MYELIDLITDEHLGIADIDRQEANRRNELLDAQNAPQQWFYMEIEEEEDVILKWIPGTDPQRIRFHEFYD